MDQLQSADIGFMLVCSALVLLMTPGLAFFYGGMVRRKNVLSTMMHSYAMMGAATLVWVMVGYSLAFGDDVGGFIGNLRYVGLQGVGLAPLEGSTIPHMLFMVFQGMFAIITPALISGAYAERMKFSAMMVFSSLWIILAYAPVCHWVWGGGFLSNDGALDFAGGTVVHINSAMSALVAVLFLGKRKGYGKEALPPHNVPFTALGAGLLWFGWFGFNGGSALAANGDAVQAFVTTHIAAAAGGIGWMLVDWKTHKANLLGFVSGAVAGLVVITPACAFVSPMAALLLGLIGGVVCNLAVLLRHKLQFDDTLDVVGIHGVGGTIGAILVALLCADQYVTGSRLNQLWIQTESVLVTYGYAALVTAVLLVVIDKTMGLRISDEDEYKGADVSEHGEVAYNL